MNKQTIFTKELSKIGSQVQNQILKSSYNKLLKPNDIYEGSLNYPSAIGKALRPAILIFSCGAVGGDIKKAMPAACGVELFHTWTLVHDDIIDNDNLRRGKPSVHAQFYLESREKGYSEKEALDYGRNIAILVGDIQHSWSVWFFIQLYQKHNISPELVLSLISEMEKGVSPLLIEGETLDVQYEKKKIKELSLKNILDMSAKKTGELYGFAAKAGAMIGLNVSNTNNKLVKAVSQFCFNCGVAFQLQDDILDLTSQEKKFGKPIGSDIREGKRTTIIWYAYQKANSSQKKKLNSILGKKKATKREIKEAINLVESLGGIDKTQKLASKYLKKAVDYLDYLPDSKYKNLLGAWASYMTSRSV